MTPHGQETPAHVEGNVLTGDRWLVRWKWCARCGWSRVAGIAQQLRWHHEHGDHDHDRD